MMTAHPTCSTCSITVLDPDVLTFALESLPPAPARVLEVGAGEGELALALARAGYDVTAVDPASAVDHVRPVPLAELREPRHSFDAAISIVALHHVEPLLESCRHLAELVRPGGTLVLDEIDVEAFDERAAGWWLEHHSPSEHDHASTPEEAVAFLRQHIHDVPTMKAALEEFFELGPPVYGPYLYRWELPPELRAAEEELIAAGELPAVGLRIVGTRRPGPA
jgi:SAM-dependent methyltransferase